MSFHSICLMVPFLVLLQCQKNSIDNKDNYENQLSIQKVEVNKSRPYTFQVTIKSPDTGCEQYADWWEVLSTDGKLLYRRILLHSHVSEQPFTRGGGPVDIGSDQMVIVRGHMNNLGYSGKIMVGSVDQGFEESEIEPDFATALEQMEPLPDGCDF